MFLAQKKCGFVFFLPEKLSNGGFLCRDFDNDVLFSCLITHTSIIALIFGAKIGAFRVGFGHYYVLV